MSTFGNEKFALECCDKLIALHAWPVSKINVERWLANFASADIKYALHMVSQFIYVSDQLVDAQFRSSFQNLSNVVIPNWLPRPQAQSEWNDFLQHCLIVPVQGEIPNPADSGYTFARKARQILRIDEEQLVGLDEAIAALIADHNVPIVFVDDFVGSGNQLAGTLKRRSKVAGQVGQSVHGLTTAQRRGKIYYCSLAMTSKGRKRIRDEFPGIILSSGNILGEEYNWISPQGLMWPEEHRQEGIAMISKYSNLLGYRDDYGSENDWRGFHCLGLGLAFEHSTPDASLPIFFSEHNNWAPLVTRR